MGDFHLCTGLFLGQSRDPTVDNLPFEYISLRQHFCAIRLAAVLRTLGGVSNIPGIQKCYQVIGSRCGHSFQLIHAASNTVQCIFSEWNAKNLDDPIVITSTVCSRCVKYSHRDTITVKIGFPSDTMKEYRDPVDSKVVLHLSLAILLAIRCRQKDATLQLLARMYHIMEEDQGKQVMNRLIYLLEPKERDWLSKLV